MDIDTSAVDGAQSTAAPESRWKARILKLWSKFRTRWRMVLLTVGKYILAMVAIGIYASIFTICHGESTENRYVVSYKPVNFTASAYLGFNNYVCLEQRNPEGEFVVGIECSADIGVTNPANITIGNTHFHIDFRPVQKVRAFLAPLVGVSVTGFILLALGLVADVFRKTQRHDRNRLVILCVVTTVLYITAFMVQIVSWVVIDIAQRAIEAVDAKDGKFSKGVRAFQLQAVLFGILFLIVVVELALFFERHWPSG